jgi:hypothetical protein
MRKRPHAGREDRLSGSEDEDIFSCEPGGGRAGVVPFEPLHGGSPEGRGLKRYILVAIFLDFLVPSRYIRLTSRHLVEEDFQNQASGARRKRKKGGKLMGNQEEVLSLMQKLQSLPDRYRVSDLLELFNDDAQYQVMDHSILTEKETIRQAFEYDAAANTELRFINLVPHRDGLTCQLIARNDRLEAMGIDEVFYTSCTISLREGRIQKFVATVEEKASRRIKQRVQTFVAWLAREHPAEFSRLCTPDGDLIYNAANGRECVPLIKEWWNTVQKG